MLKWLEEWYKSNCNDDWEHAYGIKICNLDNPGWSIEIELLETKYESKKMEKISIDRTENDWLRCEIEGNVFLGRGGTENLYEMLEIFKNWIGKNQ